MGFTPTFYAGRPKLSEVTIDSDLNMGGRNILRVGRIDSPYMPETWPTEELDWGDGEPEQLYDSIHSWPNTYAEDQTIMTVASGTRVIVTVASIPTSWSVRDVAVKINDEVVASQPGSLGGSKTFPPFAVNAGDVIAIRATGNGKAQVTIESTGEVYEGKTFDLTGKWLALGIDMKGLDATVKIQGVEMPYSDYAKYFPLAPTELTIPGEWDASQIRPIVEVYL